MGLYDIDVVTIDGRRQSMGDFRGKTLLVVNVASQCGFTPQYRGLQALYERYKDRGFLVLGFPCDQFGHQEPGSEEEIQRFCSTTYDVTFPLFSKVKVNGEEAHPLFKHLKGAKSGVLGTGSIKWNFTKFLVGPDGAVQKRYGTTETPESIDADVAALLDERS